MAVKRKKLGLAYISFWFLAWVSKYFSERPVLFILSILNCCFPLWNCPLGFSPKNFNPLFSAFFLLEGKF